MKIAFVGWVVAIFIAGAFEAQAQGIRKSPQVAFVFWRAPLSELTGPQPAHPVARQLRDSMAELGWIEGSNITYRWASAGGDHARTGPILEELVGAKVDVLVLSGDEMAIDAKARTKSIPIVMMYSAAPVERGIAASHARPGGNVTGVTTGTGHTGNLAPKRLALLKEMAPNVTRVAVLMETTYVRGATNPYWSPEIEKEVRPLGIALTSIPLNSPDEIEPAIAEAVRRGANGLYVESSVSSTGRNVALIRELAERHKLPAVYRFLDAVDSGGLMGYGHDESERHRRTAGYVDRILRGAKAAELPMQSPGGYRLVINANAARAIGLEIPQSLATQADRIIR
jgi:putative ABC transport system substrate-binding protein